mgnify:CR=1 FL=1
MASFAASLASANPRGGGGGGGGFASSGSAGGGSSFGRGGTMVIVGMPASGVTASIDPGTIANEGQRILGSKMGSSQIADDIPNLVALYLDRLASRAVAGYDAETAWQDYRSGTILGFAYAIVALGGLDHDDARSAALPRTMLSRSVLAMTDLRCVLPDR